MEERGIRNWLKRQDRGRVRRVAAAAELVRKFAAEAMVVKLLEGEGYQLERVAQCLDFLRETASDLQAVLTEKR
jgi:hypothetical protein